MYVTSPTFLLNNIAAVSTLRKIDNFDIHYPNLRHITNSPTHQPSHILIHMYVKNNIRKLEGHSELNIQ